jgi:hypothetical protein
MAKSQNFLDSESQIPKNPTPLPTGLLGHRRVSKLPMANQNSYHGCGRDATVGRALQTT